MSAIPSTSISLPNNLFIGENVDLTIGFDNTDLVDTGYGPFVLFYIDKTGTDGDDGLSFNGASYLGADVTTTEITLDNSGSSTFEVFGVEQTVATPANFTSGDTLVVLELPFGSFVPDQPRADISVSLTGNINSDLDTPINLQTQGGFVFGNTPTEETNGSDDPIYGNTTSETVNPQLVTLTKNYIGPEDETATGPSYVRQFELVIDIAEGQTISNLDVTDILPDNMQFVDVVSIVDSTGTEINSSRITEVSTPDDGGLTSIGSENITENDVDTDGVATPGGTLSRRIDSITGSTGDRDLVLTYEFFIPRLDDDTDVIINADTGDDIISTNESQLGDNDGGDSNNIWDPVDTRDSNEEVYIPPTATDPNFPTHDLEDQSIAIQKSVTNISDAENTPGDVLEYTIDFQVSDYFAFQNIDIFDTFSDGQRFDTSFTPELYVTEHGQNSGTLGTPLDFTAANYIVDQTQIGNDTNTATDGSTEVTFEISDELITRSFDDGDGLLIGGGVPDGGFNDGGTSLNNNPPLPNGATEGQIVFRTVIQQEYSDTFDSGDASVDIGDRLFNDAIIDGEVLDVDDLSVTGFTEDDDTAAEVFIQEGELYKSIYAINGEIFSGADTDSDLSNGLDGYASGINIAPGDEVTYRLTYELPTTDVEDLTLTDYFPLPIYDAETEIDLVANPFNPTVSIAPPDPGETKYGPLDTFSTRTDASSNTPNLSVLVSSNDSNKLTFSYDDFDDDNNQSSIVDLLVTVTAEDEPAADGLVYTNQVRQMNNTTLNDDSFKDAIVQVVLDQPEVADITKGIVAFSSDNTDIAFSPAFTTPSGVNFATGGGTTFPGVVSSTDLDSTPLDSNLTGGLEAGDIVTFALLVENEGTSRKGAFDVTIKDDLPTGFAIPSGGLNLNVTDGTGATITYTGLDDNDASGDDLFGTGIELDDPGSTSPAGSGAIGDIDAGALDAYDADSGENLAIVTFDLEVDGNAPYLNSDDTPNTAEEITNTASLVSYANIEGGEDFPGSSDTATVEIELPEATKSIVATSEEHTDETGDGSENNNANRRKATIGEIVRYRLVATIPEGTAHNFQLKDRLPGGLQFIDDGTTKVAFVSDDAPITSVTTTTNFSNPLDLGLGSPGAFDGDLWISGTTDSGITPTFTLPDINSGSWSSQTSDPDNYFSGIDPYFKFGDITNLDQDEDDEYVIVEFNALVTNDYQRNSEGTAFPTNDFNEDRINRVQVNVGTGENFNTSDELVLSDQNYLRIVEPQLSLLKEVGSDPTFSTNTYPTDSGNTIQFRLTFDNASNVNQNSSAFDVELTDLVPGGLTLAGIDSIEWNDGDGSGGNGTESSINSGTGFAAGEMTITPSFDTGTGAISVNVNEMPTDASISVIYSVTTDGTVNPDDLLTNTADITYTSLPGTGTTSNPTGSDNTVDGAGDPTVGGTPRPSGDLQGERNGDDGVDTAPNDYAETSSASVQIEPLEPLKALVATSESHTAGNDVAIGEIVRYQLSVAIPEGETDGFTITDNLPDGLIYLDDGTVNIAFIADETGISSSNTDINNITDINLTGTAITSPDTDADLISSAIADSGADGSFSSGEDVTFNLGDLTNADRDSDDEYVVIEFNALVENIADNTDGGTNDPLKNNFTVDGDIATEKTSNNVDVDIVEPVINDVSKTPNSTTGDAGNPITYTVEFSNSGNATAFDLNIVDNLPSGLDNLAVTSTTIYDDADPKVDKTSDFTINTTATQSTNNQTADGDGVDAFDIAINRLPAGYSVEIEYTAIIVEDVAPDTDINNTVDVTYSSLPGDDTDGSSSSNPGTPDTDILNNPTGSDVNDTTSGNANSERNSSTNGGGAGVNDYTDDSDATVSVDPLDLTKSLVNTDVDNVDNDDSTEIFIDETLTYRLKVKVPEGEIDSFSIRDPLPNGLTYIENSAKVALIGDTSTAITSDQISGTSAFIADTAGIANITPAFAFEPPGTPFVSGEDLVFDLGTLTNNDDDADAEYVVVEFKAIADNPGDSSGSLDNIFSIGSNDSNTVNVTIGLDYGDAPDAGGANSEGNYDTTDASGGAAHYVTDGLTIGTNVDDDSGSLQNNNATADNNTDTADEDGVTISPTPLNIYQDDSYSVTVDVNNTSGDPATLVGWIDFNQNGIFDPSEAAMATVPDGTTNADADITLTWSTAGGNLPAPADIKAGDTYARFRLSTDADLDANLATGIVDDGEVEDYKLNIGIDYGDAPDADGTIGEGNYDTTDANGGAAHGIVDGLTIGTTVDDDSGSLENADATADDSSDTSNEGSDTNDEDGVTISSTPLNVNKDDSYSVTVDVNNTTGEDATLVGWIDFNQNGVFDPSEAVTADVPAGTTNADADITLTWDRNGSTSGSGFGVLPNATDIELGDTYARFRLSTDADLDATLSTGFVDDGEVEDYKLNIGIDYGDAPDVGGTNGEGNYDTTDASGGAAHGIVDGLTIGTTVDDDSGSLQDDDATADELDGIADENGVTISPTPLNVNKDDSYSVTVDVNNTTGEDATLVGWIDFNQDGIFDPDEAATATVPDGTTNADADITLTWSTAGGNLPPASDIELGDTYARFRLSTDADLDGTLATGFVDDGEVEDYKLNIGIDYGDAPDADGTIGKGNYDTTVDTDGGTADTGGAAHGIIDGLTIGSLVDDDSGSLQDNNATADELDGTADEDGVTILDNDFDPVTEDTYAIEVAVTNDTGEPATLVGWVDFNQDGVFDSSEAVTATVPDGTTTSNPITLTWDRNGTNSGDTFGVLPDASNIVSGFTYSRFRLSTDADLDATLATGFVDDGEVEDYRLAINVDYGDAPDTGDNSTGTGDYLTTEANGGASHGIDSQLTLGSNVDADDGTLQNAAASADGADDDAIASFSILETGADSYSIDVDVTNETGGDATLVGWIDFNQNGTFDSDEGVSIPVPDDTGLQNVELKWDNNDGAFPNIPNDIVAGDTYARFRLSTDPDLDINLSTGFVDNGEVEDYKLTIYNTVTGNPYSDPLTEDNDVPDIITGGEGQDTLFGGTGEDIFVYTKTSDGVDIIEDFEDGTDLIDFRAIVAGELGGIDFSGTNPIDAGYVDVVSFGDHTMIQVDFDNTNTFPKDVLLLDNVDSNDISVADFIF